MEKKITVIGGGLAGCEAAWSAAQAGAQVTLIEMKPLKFSPAHKYGGFAELVCSNSLKASRVNSAAGLLKEEMRRLGSVTVPCAEENAVAAGGALAVDREKFSDSVTKKIRSHPNITVKNEICQEIPEGCCIIASGPLTEGRLAESIGRLCGNRLSFFDAAAPIVTFDSVNMDKAFFAARYGRGGDDYINCPFTKEEYLAFHSELVNAQSAPVHDFDRPENSRDDFTVYEGCMPIEVLAKRGEDAARYGAMKPVGLTDSRTGIKPYAVVQLRRENAEGTLFNLVGFQTNLKFPEQKRVFSMIPGLENAEFVRYGVMHRNSFIDSPRLLNGDFSMRNSPEIFFAGQITGVEGYMESAASGILAGINAVRRLDGKAPLILPRETMTGALSRYISDETVENFQPMGANMGILPDIGVRIKDKQERYQAVADRALAAFEEYMEGISDER
ncbi:MAG: methylenetetrahydrofolate--tRNA-(uracil(54)-C(5))-methyltransferase (FADH(2)-oxidizing) TrmFO [Oscillospiraceae bacterium]|nr:methylenetetrahydrofolate--tRNA-(uracil(54)-C(5))-methyltransferase (FADH(2)-oxidizing) TrmFO [Oscillospiraceae bacterium]